MVKEICFFILFGCCLLCAPYSGQATEVPIDLAAGWNLINSPVQPDDKSLAAVLGGVLPNTTSAWKWVGSNWAVALPGADDGGMAYATSKNFSQLVELNSGEGVWLNMTNPCQLVLNGQYPVDSKVQLIEGWNLVGLRGPQPLTVANIAVDQGLQIVSIWKWTGKTWAVSLPDKPDKGQAYASSKNFTLLEDIKAAEGFWVNVTTAAATTTTSTTVTQTTTTSTTGIPATTTTITLPPVIAEGKVLARIDGILTPVAGASVMLNNKVIGTSDHLGLFHYQTANNLTVTVKAAGFPDRVGLLAASNVRSYFWLDQPEDAPDFTTAPVTLYKATDETKFKEYPNLFIMEATVALSAKPTPKEISDGTASLTITEMALKKDTTAAVTTFKIDNPKINGPAVTALLGGGQTTHLIGGADVMLSDSMGNPTTSEAAGFGGKVRPTLKDKNLSDAAMTLLAMQQALDNGTGTISLYYYLDAEWHLAGKGMISTTKVVNSNDVYSVRSAPGVVMDGLYPFLFIYAGKKVVTGQVVSGLEPVANALVTMHGSDDMAVTEADGTFQLSVPDLLSEVSLTIFHEAYYLKKATATFIEAETTTDAGQLTLLALPQVGVHGLVTDQHILPLAEIKVVLHFAQIPPNIVFPKQISATTDSSGSYDFPTVPLDLLAQASVEASTTGGYHTVLDQALPAADEGTVSFDFSMVAPLWTYPTNGHLYSTPVVMDGGVYLGGIDGLMRKLDATNGTELWKKDVEKPIFATPVFDSVNLYFGTVGNQFTALNRTTGENASLAFPMEVYPSDFGINDNYDVVASAALVGGGLTFGCNDNTIHFIGTDGSLLTSNDKTIANNITGSAAVDNNSLYFGSWDGRFYSYSANALQITMQQQWQFPAADQAPLPARILSSPVLADGKVYFGGGNNLTVSLTDQQGLVTDHPFTTSAVDPQTVTFSEDVASWKITVNQEDKTLYCLNAANGSLEWSLPLDGAVVGRPAITGQTMIVGTLNETAGVTSSGTVSAFNLSAGQPTSAKWTFQTGGPVYSSPVVAGNRVYFGSEDHWLYCLNAETGAKLWAMKTGDKIIASPVVANGKVYIVSLDGKLYCIAE